MLENTNKILKNKTYTELLNKLNDYEKDRVFCRHTIEHFVDLARIAYIKVLEEKLPYDKDLIYTIALLHDIGRVMQYEDGIEHHEASAIVAKDLLECTNFSVDDKNAIIAAIGEHRGQATSKLSSIIKKSDKESRLCFNCKAEEQCYWSIEKKNMELIL